MSKFTTEKTDYNDGFAMTFKNGWTISVQFGRINDCHRQGDFSLDAEIAIWDDENGWYNFGNGIVKGYCDADEVATWIYKVANW